MIFSWELLSIVSAYWPLQHVRSSYKSHKTERAFRPAFNSFTASHVVSFLVELLMRGHATSTVQQQRSTRILCVTHPTASPAWRNVFGKNRSWKNMLLPWFMVRPLRSMFNGYRDQSTVTQHPCSCAPRCVLPLHPKCKDNACGKQFWCGAQHPIASQANSKNRKCYK